MVPRWVWVVAGILAAFWIYHDPAGAGDFLSQVGDSIMTFFNNLG